MKDAANGERPPQFDEKGRRIPRRKKFQKPKTPPPNLFEDDGTIAPEEMVTNSDCPEKLGVQVKSNVAEGDGLVDAQCYLCQKWFRVAPILAVNYRRSNDGEDANTWRCSNCGPSRK